MASKIAMIDRYAATVRCGQNHSGNKRYAPVGRPDGEWLCAGCGHAKTAADILEAQRHPRPWDEIAENVMAAIEAKAYHG